VDSGSTHSISAVVASRLALQPEPQAGLMVVITNGNHVASDSVCHATRVIIGSEEFIMDLFMIPLDNFDMVLGVQWLCFLGPIHWDFDRCRMSCWHVDHRVVCQGVPQQRMTAAAQALAAPDLMQLLLQEFDDVFATPLDCPHFAATTTAFTFFQRLCRWLSASTGTCSWSKMNWSGSAMACCSRR
jgi:hypothetical protein